MRVWSGFLSFEFWLAIVGYFSEVGADWYGGDGGLVKIGRLTDRGRADGLWYVEKPGLNTARVLVMECYYL